jgi:hypothetical protein
MHNSKSNQMIHWEDVDEDLNIVSWFEFVTDREAHFIHFCWIVYEPITSFERIDHSLCLTRSQNWSLGCERTKWNVLGLWFWNLKFSFEWSVFRKERIAVWIFNWITGYWRSTYTYKCNQTNKNTNTNMWSAVQLNETMRKKKLFSYQGQYSLLRCCWVLHRLLDPIEHKKNVDVSSQRSGENSKRKFSKDWMKDRERKTKRERERKRKRERVKEWKKEKKKKTWGASGVPYLDFSSPGFVTLQLRIPVKRTSN